MNLAIFDEGHHIQISENSLASHLQSSRYYYEELLLSFKIRSTMNHAIIRKIQYYLPFQFIQIQELKTLKQELQTDLLIGALESLTTQIMELKIILVLQASKDQYCNILLQSSFLDFVSIY
jgi:hypothetical protein